MKRAIVAILSWLFGLIAPLTILLVTLYLLFSTPDFLKEAFRQSLVYRDVPKFLIDQVDAAAKTTPEIAPLKGIITDEFSEQYLEGKVGSFLDQTYDYASGNSDMLPYVSMSDVLNKIRKRFPLVDNITQLPTIFTKGYRLPKNQADVVKNIATYTKLATIYGAAACLTLFILILAWGYKGKQTLADLSKLFFKIGLPSLISTGLAILVMKYVPLPPVRLPGDMELLQQALADFITFVTNNVLLYLAAGYGTFTALGAIFYFMSLGHHDKKEETDHSPTETPKQ